MWSNWWPGGASKGVPVQSCVIMAVLIAVCLRFASGDAYSKSFVMEEYCGDLIDLDYRKLSMIQVKLTERDQYRPLLTCKFAVRAPPGHRLLMKVEWIDIAKGHYGKCSDFLSVRNGDFSNTSDLILKPLCGDGAPDFLVSEERAILLHFDSNALEQGSGFAAMFTAFHEGRCRDGEFACDNGRCIDDRLNCDDHDNCGDDSDNCLTSVGTVVAVVVITILVFVLFVGAAILFCHRDKIKFRKKCPVIGADPDGVYQPTTEPVAPNGNNQEATAV